MCRPVLFPRGARKTSDFLALQDCIIRLQHLVGARDGGPSVIRYEVLGKGQTQCRSTQGLWFWNWHTKYASAPRADSVMPCKTSYCSVANVLSLLHPVSSAFLEVVFSHFAFGGCDFETFQKFFQSEQQRAKLSDAR